MKRICSILQLVGGSGKRCKLPIIPSGVQNKALIENAFLLKMCRKNVSVFSVHHSKLRQNSTVTKWYFCFGCTAFRGGIFSCALYYFPCVIFGSRWTAWGLHNPVWLFLGPRQQQVGPVDRESSRIRPRAWRKISQDSRANHRHCTNNLAAQPPGLS